MLIILFRNDHYRKLKSSARSVLKLSSLRHFTLTFCFLSFFLFMRMVGEINDGTNQNEKVGNIDCCIRSIEHPCSPKCSPSNIMIDIHNPETAKRFCLFLKLGSKIWTVSFWSTFGDVLNMWTYIQTILLTNLKHWNPHKEFKTIEYTTYLWLYKIKYDYFMTEQVV